MRPGRSLPQLLRAADIDPDAEPVEAWRRLRAVEDSAATIIDLYELAARQRGLTAAALPVAERRALARSVMPDMWPGWQVTDGTDRAGDLIEIVDYDPSWPDRFTAWQRVLQRALGETALRIEHVGSTAVSGLAAKPTVDVQISVADLADEPAYVPAVEAIGLQLRSRDDFHRYFRPRADRPRDVNVHVCQIGSDWETDHLRFRDYLRTHADARDEYAQAKRAAAELWTDDGLAYTDAKTAVVLDILDRANAPG